MRECCLILGFLIAGITADINIKYLNQEENESLEDNVKIEWLTEINRPVVRDAIVDVNLYQIGEEEECYLSTPDRVIINFIDIKENTLKTHPSSAFVSCRVTIGPITDEQLGNWTIVGHYKKDDIDYIRKQRVVLNWLDPQNSEAAWSVTNEDLVKYVVNFGFSISPLVYTSVTVVNCHVVTPNGEDLTVSLDSKYPNITRVAHFLGCNIQFGPIHNDMLGDWILYLTTRTRHQIRSPINLHLYDENNPYDQAYNRTNLEPLNKIVHLGNTITAQVLPGRTTTNVDSCSLQKPNGDIDILHKGFDFNGVKLENTSASCSISIGPIVENLLGEWTLIGKFSGRGIFHEIIQQFHIIEEDPSNPLEDSRRRIILLNETRVETDLNTTHKFTIPSQLLPNVTDTCHIITPDGLQYKFLDTFNVTGVEVLEPNAWVACGVHIKLLSESQIGNWTLISRETTGSELIERRLPITIYVEDWVKTSPSADVVISPGNNFYIRLEESTKLHSTCKVIPPKGIRSYELDKRFVDRCGRIVRNVTEADSGIWEINYGTKIVYRAQLRLDVLASHEPIIKSLSLEKDRPVNMMIGPKNALFCRVIDPLHNIVYNGRGMCRIVLQNVLNRHGGNWKLYLALPGRMMDIEHDLSVSVVEAASIPIVTTKSSLVNESSLSIVLSCSASLPNKIRSCQFRQPNGRFLIANHGLGEHRYSFHGEGMRFHLNKYHIDCGIKINNPRFDDLGTWRCAIETINQTYFGFVNIPQIEFQDDAKIDVHESDITALPAVVKVVEGDITQMVCQTNVPISYCYFRSENGTVFNLSPGRSAENYEYIGEGFEAGVCGMIIRKTSVGDDGLWTCNIGTRDLFTEEYKYKINLNVDKIFEYDQYLLADFSMVLGGVVHRELEYCRFVRSDGLGFTLNNLPPGYLPLSGIELGQCGLVVQSPSSLDRASWTIAFKIVGQLHEISVETALVNNSNVGFPMYALISIYVLIAFFGFLIISTIIIALLPLKNRERTLARFVNIRESLRKKPLKEINTQITHSLANENSAPSA